MSKKENVILYNTVTNVFDTIISDFKYEADVTIGTNKSKRSYNYFVASTLADWIINNLDENDKLHQSILNNDAQVRNYTDYLRRYLLNWKNIIINITDLYLSNQKEIDDLYNEDPAIIENTPELPQNLSLNYDNVFDTTDAIYALAEMDINWRNYLINRLDDISECLEEEAVWKRDDNTTVLEYAIPEF